MHTLSALIVYERLSKIIDAFSRESSKDFMDNMAESIEIEEMRTSLIPSCMCIISRYPFFHTFHSILHALHSGSKKGLEYPIEFYVSCVVCRVPVPPRGIYDVEVSLGKHLPTFLLKQPPVNQLPLLDVDFRTLPKKLSLENTIKILNVILLEHSVLFISKDLYSITYVIEAVMALLFPFEYQMVYIPLLPKSMLEFLSSPVPFVSGIDASLLADALESVYSGTCIVNVDKDVVEFKAEDSAGLVDSLKDMEMLPKHEVEKILDKLHDTWYPPIKL
eukprot:TRINITY_DN10385_c0_g4_i1.p1 TRINITY_DN10385_c0_g4~~TRINITY_DN10385_c0_g4_i1.p1  ORF type:complete len:276 (+),score=66.20 TRINITY_DN10385_c0_g4_i1:492-1319(+)